MAADERAMELAVYGHDAEGHPPPVRQPHPEVAGGAGGEFYVFAALGALPPLTPTSYLAWGGAAHPAPTCKNTGTERSNAQKSPAKPDGYFTRSGSGDFRRGEVSARVAGGTGLPAAPPNKQASAVLYMGHSPGECDVGSPLVRM